MRELNENITLSNCSKKQANLISISNLQNEINQFRIKRGISKRISHHNKINFTFSYKARKIMCTKASKKDTNPMNNNEHKKIIKKKKK